MKLYIHNRDIQYLVGMVLEELKRSWANNMILENPRSIEISESVIEIGEQFGMIIDVSMGTIYRRKMESRLEYLLSSNMIEVDDRERAIVNMPKKVPEEIEEMRIYEPTENMGVKRTIEIKERGTITETSTSYMNEQAIETNREVYKRNKGTINLERMTKYPHIVKATINGKEEYFDISKSERPENIDIEGGIKIGKEEIAEIEPVDKLRLVQKAQYTVYEDGIKELYGINNEKEQNVQEEIK